MQRSPCGTKVQHSTARSSCADALTVLLLVRKSLGACRDSPCTAGFLSLSSPCSQRCTGFSSAPLHAAQGKLTALASLRRCSSIPQLQAAFPVGYSLAQKGCLEQGWQGQRSFCTRDPGTGLAPRSCQSKGQDVQWVHCLEICREGREGKSSLFPFHKKRGISVQPPVPNLAWR